MLKVIKKKIKEIDTWYWNIFFKHVKRFSYLKYYPKGRNHLYDILVNENRNDNFVIFDVGANIGQTASFYNNILNAPKIFCFEPITKTFNKLKKNTRQVQNIYCYNIGLGAENTELKVNVGAESLNNSLVESVYQSFSSNEEQKVIVKTVDEVFREIPVKAIDIFKIDTEGYELEVLRGAEKLLKSGKIKYVFSEVGFNSEADKTEFADINDFLKKYDFKLCGFYDAYMYGTNARFIRYVNALFMIDKK